MPSELGNVDRLGYTLEGVVPPSDETIMVAPVFDDEQFREALKAAVVEVVDDRSDLLREMLAEVVEDVALARAIQEGARSDPDSRDEIFRILDEAE